MRTNPDAYFILQVDPQAEDYVISAAYRAAARRYHPDGRAPDVARITSLNDAYDRVKTPEARHRYDAERSQPVAVGPGRPAPIYDAWPDAPMAPPTSADDSDTLDFGRYAGWKISDVARIDPAHLRWLGRNATGSGLRLTIARHLAADGETVRRTPAAR
jgi:hypothetical protein